MHLFSELGHDLLLTKGAKYNDKVLNDSEKNITVMFPTNKRKLQSKNLIHANQYWRENTLKDSGLLSTNSESS